MITDINGDKKNDLVVSSYYFLRGMDNAGQRERRLRGRRVIRHGWVPE